MTKADVVVRAMTAGDVETVAALHAGSWRTAYRGILSDAYLDGGALENRRAHWRARLLTPGPRQAGFIADHAGAPAGLAFLLGDDDPEYGTLLDNLHVLDEARRLGLGRTLLAACAREVLARGWQPRLHLWVFEVNSGARRFYERHGGVARGIAPLVTSEGTAHPTVRYAWDDVSTLL